MTDYTVRTVFEDATEADMEALPAFDPASSIATRLFGLLRIATIETVEVDESEDGFVRTDRVSGLFTRVGPYALGEAFGTRYEACLEEETDFDGTVSVQVWPE